MGWRQACSTHGGCGAFGERRGRLERRQGGSERAGSHAAAATAAGAGGPASRASCMACNLPLLPVCGAVLESLEWVQLDRLGGGQASAPPGTMDGSDGLQMNWIGG